jgi:hypothetical protein
LHPQKGACQPILLLLIDIQLLVSPGDITTGSFGKAG